MAPGWRPTFAAVTFGLMSLSSPWLWSVHSRRVSRDALKAEGLIEPHAVRLGATRWTWHPIRSVRVMWAATWDGERDPGRAIAGVYPVAGPEPQTVLSKVPSSVLDAAKSSMRATYAAGNPLSLNQLTERFSLSRAQATKVRDEVFSLNGSGPDARAERSRPGLRRMVGRAGRGRAVETHPGQPPARHPGWLRGVQPRPGALAAPGADPAAGQGPLSHGQARRQPAGAWPSSCSWRSQDRRRSVISMTTGRTPAKNLAWRSKVVNEQMKGRRKREQEIRDGRGCYPPFPASDTCHRWPAR